MSNFISFSNNQAEKFLKLLELSEAGLSEFITLISERLEDLTAKDVAWATTSSLKKVDRKLAFSILDVLMPFCFGFASKGEKVETTVNSALAALALTVPGEQLAIGKRTELKKRLTKLLNADGFMLKAKAFRLLHDTSNTFSEASILSDIRPIFLDQPSLTVEAAVVIHNLKIDYHQDGGSTKQLYVSMDSVDLAKLAKTIDRALKKDSALSKVISKANLAFIQTKAH